MGKITEDLKIYTHGSEKKQPIIFVHGFPYDNSMWSNQVEKLKENYYCVTYDIRGLGKSAVGSGQHTMETFTDDLFAVINEYNLIKPVLCGLSMGGYISFRALEREQEKFKAVIFCDTKPVADDNANKLRRCAGIKRIDTEGVEKFVKDFVPNCFSNGFITDNAVKYNYILEKAALSSPTGVKGALIAMLSRTDSTDFLPNISIPTLVISGEYDKLSTPEQMKAFTEKIPGAVFKVISNAGHMTPIENGDEFNGVMEDFLKNL
jgi:Predicted hydrolases or acyltransferases (alpha/beta hydrolase superfamily)